MGGEKAVQEILSGLNIYNPSQGVQYVRVVAEQQVAIHFSSDKYLTDHTEAGKKSWMFSIVKQWALHARTLTVGKNERLLLKTLPGFIISWIEQFVVATVCWRNEVCKQIYLLSCHLKQIRAWLWKAKQEIFNRQVQFRSATSSFS